MYCTLGEVWSYLGAGNKLVATVREADVEHLGGNSLLLTSGISREHYLIAVPLELLGEHLGTEVGEPPELLEPAPCSWQELGGGEGAAEVAAEQPPPEGAVPGAGERLE